MQGGECAFVLSVSRPAIDDRSNNAEPARDTANGYGLQDLSSEPDNSVDFVGAQLGAPRWHFLSASFDNLSLFHIVESILDHVQAQANPSATVLAMAAGTVGVVDREALDDLVVCIVGKNYLLAARTERRGNSEEQPKKHTSSKWHLTNHTESYGA